MTQNNTGDEKLQIIIAMDRLSAMSPNITDEDRTLAVNKLQISKRTIARYEKEGTGTNLDTAMLLIGFFGKRIELREKVLAR